MNKKWLILKIRIAFLQSSLAGGMKVLNLITTKQHEHRMKDIEEDLYGAFASLESRHEGEVI